MTYAVFQLEQTEYLKSATPQGTPSSIPHIPEKFYGDDYTVKLLNSDGIQERLDMLRAAAEIEGRPFDENKEKGRLIAETAGYLNPSIPKEQLPAKFFAAENFASQSRNIGKIDIKQQNIVLSADEKRHCQTLYDDTKETHPQAKGQELNVLVAQAIVRDAWARKAETEAALENPATAKDILFDKEAAARQTKSVAAVKTAQSRQR